MICLWSTSILLTLISAAFLTFPPASLPSLSSSMGLSFFSSKSRTTRIWTRLATNFNRSISKFLSSLSSRSFHPFPRMFRLQTFKIVKHTPRCHLILSREFSLTSLFKRKTKDFTRQLRTSLTWWANLRPKSGRSKSRQRRKRTWITAPQAFSCRRSTRSIRSKLLRMQNRLV